MGYFIHEDQPAGLPLANVDQLNDVNITSPADKDVLAYDATSQKWVNDSSINSALLSDTGWVRTDPTSATNTTMYRKKGYTVTVLIQVNGAVADGTVLGTLPAECRPPRTVYVRNYNIASVATQNFTSIAADGKITKIGGGGEWVNATLTYVV